MINFFKSLSIVLAAMADKLNVKLVIGGNEAYTTWDKVVIPDMASEGDYSGVKDLMLGYLIHEGGHLNFTEKDCYISKIKTLKEYFQGVMNINEDFLVESSLISMYPNTQLILSKLAYYVFVSNIQQEYLEFIDILELIKHYYRLSVRSKIPGQEFLLKQSEMVGKLIIKTIDCFDIKEIDKFIVKNFEKSKISKTENSYTIAVEFEKLLRNLLSKEPEITDKLTDNKPEEVTEATNKPDKPNESGESGEPDKTSESGESGESSMSYGDESLNSTNNQTKINAGINDDVNHEIQPLLTKSKDECQDQISNFIEQLDNDEVTQSHDYASVLKDDYSEVIRKELNEEMVSIIQKSMQIDSSFTVRISTEDITPFLHVTNKNHFDEIIQKTSKLSTVFKDIITSEHDVGTLETDRGKLNSKRLYRSGLNSNFIFKQRENIEEINTAFHFLGDLSISMRGHGQKAMDSIYAIGSAMELIENVSIAVSVFGPANDNVIPIIRRGQRIRNNFKFFNGGMEDGNTPLDFAIGYAAKELSSLEESKKIIFIITDGMPNDFNNTLKMIKSLQKNGIKIIGIGIGECIYQNIKAREMFNTLFDNGEILLSIDDLQKCALSLARKFI